MSTLTDPADPAFTWDEALAEPAAYQRAPLPCDHYFVARVSAAWTCVYCGLAKLRRL